MIVWLTDLEADEADARAERIDAKHEPDTGRYALRGDAALDRLRSGVRCEVAASKWSGEPLQPLELAARHEPDVGYFDVRGTQFHAGGLIVHTVDEGDPPERPYLLVVEHDRTAYRVVGWAYGHEAQQARYWRDDERMRWPCFLVPQYDLRPPASLLIARASRADT